MTTRARSHMDSNLLPYEFHEVGEGVALGTDAAVYPHGLNAHEIDVYVNQFGMTPLQGIQTGTLNAADLMGWTDRAGSIAAGKWADINVVDGDSLKDVRVLQHVGFVMKSGAIYKDAAKQDAAKQDAAKQESPQP